MTSLNIKLGRDTIDSDDLVPELQSAVVIDAAVW